MNSFLNRAWHLTIGLILKIKKNFFLKIKFIVVCRNLSYGRQNDENKRALHKAGGIPSLVRLLTRSPEPDVQELVTGVLWNLSSCEVIHSLISLSIRLHWKQHDESKLTKRLNWSWQELKRIILEEALTVLVAQVIIPHSGWDRMKPGPTHWTALLRNASGILR